MPGSPQFPDDSANCQANCSVGVRTVYILQTIQSLFFEKAKKSVIWLHGSRKWHTGPWREMIPYQLQNTEACIECKAQTATLKRRLQLTPWHSSVHWTQSSDCNAQWLYCGEQDEMELILLLAFKQLINMCTYVIDGRMAGVIPDERYRHPDG